MEINIQKNERAYLFLTRGSCDKVERILNNIGDDDDDEDSNKEHSFEEIC